MNPYLIGGAVLLTGLYTWGIWELRGEHCQALADVAVAEKKTTEAQGVLQNTKAKQQRRVKVDKALKIQTGNLKGCWLTDEQWRDL